MSIKPNVGFVGLGAMGIGMAKHLLHEGFQVTGCDVDERAIQDFRASGGQVTRNARAILENVPDCHVLVIMVANAEQASSVLFDDQKGCALGLPRNAAVLLCITAAPECAISIRAVLNGMGRDDIVSLDCPVSGGANRAANGTLSILVSGSTELPENTAQVLQVLSSNLYHVPGPPGSAFALKMIHQILVGSHIVAANEVMGLAAVGGLDFSMVYSAVMSSDAASWLYGERVSHLQDLERPPYSSLAIILKDMGLVTATARTKQYALPMSSIAQHVFLLAKGAGFGTHDDCATIRVYLTGREHVLPHHRGKQQHVPHDEVQIGSRITIETIKSLLTGIHLATALEVFSFLEVLGLDQGIFYSFVLGAAGASTIFRKIGSQVRQKSKISLRTLHDADKVVHDLASAIESACGVTYSVPLAVTAMNCLFASKR